MSGAEALAAFGIACNVMQVIGFVRDGVQVGNAIYETGSLDPNLAQTTDCLTEGLERLKNSLEKVQPLVLEEQELLDIANGSLGTAAELKVELDKISSSLAKGKHSAAFRGWLRVVLGGKKRIEKLEKAMRDRQRILETRLLLRICNKNDALLIQQRADFDQLDRMLQGFVEARARNQTAIDQLVHRESAAVRTHVDHKTKALEQSFKATVSSESSQAQHTISSRLQNLTFNQIENEQRERLLRSFNHEKMNARRNHIMDHHDETLSWIFHSEYVNTGTDSKESLSSLSFSPPPISQVGFVQWLRLSNQLPYWISGKAGSGKSVLMKFLVENPRTKSTLENSNGSTIILSHFLWAVGQPLERNMKGILCSLIHQLLLEKPDLSSAVWEILPSARQKRFPDDWSNKDLLAVSLHVFSACEQHICIFLDGLDEIDTRDDQIVLTGLLDKLCTLPRLQVCVSSRPEPALQRYFGGCSRLRVQDLTRVDIESYAKDKLQRLNFDDPKKLNRLVDTICSKADGVFLWVSLALKSIQQGFCNHDDPAELEVRLESLPNDLNTLYQQMWRRLNDSEVVYRKEAAQYFNLMLDRQSFMRKASLILLALSLNPMLAAMVLTDDIESFASDLGKECEKISVRLPVRCAGLLELSKDGEVTFIHRSAQEFLVDTPEGQRIRNADQLSSKTRLFNLMRGLLACIRLEIDTNTKNLTTSLKLSSRIFNFCKHLGGISANAITFFSSCHDTSLEERLSADGIKEFFCLAKALYAAGKWTFDNSYQLRPDFVGAVARAGLFTQVRSEVAQLACDAPDGMAISRSEKSYILDCVFGSLEWSQENISAQDAAFLCTLNDPSVTRYTSHGCINFGHSMVGTVGEQDPPFYLTRDPFDILLGTSLQDERIDTSHYLRLVIKLLEAGYNLSNRTVILLEASTPFLSAVIRHACPRYPKFLSPGTLLIEVNTSFLLGILLRLLASQPRLFSHILDFPTIFERLNTAVEDVPVPAFSRLLGFVPLFSEKLECTESVDIHHETGISEESVDDAQSENAYCGCETYKSGRSESEQSEYDDSQSDGEYYDSDYYDSDDSERRAWASSTEVLIPRTEDDGEFVLDALSGNVFISIARGEDGFLAKEGLEVPDLQSRVQQISPNARRCTVQELEETLIEDGFLVPWWLGPDIWPPRVYSPDLEEDDKVEASVE